MHRHLGKESTMKQITALLVLSIASLDLLASAVAGDDKADKEEGFTRIFNGKNLDGWVYGLRGDKENKSGKGYDVENGVMFCTKEDGGNLFTKKEYGDFVFRFEFKLSPNANNGVGIRAPLEG